MVLDATPHKQDTDARSSIIVVGCMYVVYNKVVEVSV